MKNTLAKVFILLLSYQTLQAQDPQRSLRSTSDSLLALSANLPSENIYLHTNKDVYEAGEDLWFGALALYSQYMRMSGLSSMVFVELKSSDNNQTVASEMFSLEQGKLNGHLYLPDSLSSGEYWLMAFTANSLKYEGEPVRAAKKILVKGDIIPHVLIQASFDQEFLNNDDPVSGQIRLLTPGGDPIVDAKTVVMLKRGRKTEDRNRLRSDSTGRMIFNLKHKSEIAKLSLSVKMDHDGHEEVFERTLPYDKSKRVQLQFMPEGGSLLAGLSNKVAFKAVDESGMPFEIKKATVYADDEAVAEFKSVHDGMGQFTFFARPDVSYKVAIDEPYIDSTYLIPAVRSSGIQLNLHSQSTETLTFGIIQTTGMTLDSVHLMVKQRGVPFWLVSAKMKPNGMLFKVPMKDLAQGIVAATLFDKNHKPIAERLVFTGLEKQLEITATVDKRVHGVKEKVNLKLNVKDQNGEPVQTILNLTAVDEVFNSPFAETNMATHFLLSSDLKGKIHEPAYYFDKDNPSAKGHLDLLMLTQGWRNYTWHADHLKGLAIKEELPMVDYLIGKVDLKTLSRGAKKQAQKEVLTLSKAGAMSIDADDSWSFIVPPDFLRNSTGYEYILKVADEELAKINLIDGFAYTESNRDVAGLSHPLKRVVTQNRNWDKLYVAPPAAKEVMGVEVVDDKDTYGLQRGVFGRVYKGVSTDYVCSYNILNCTNHRFGTPPIPGQQYRYRGTLVTYQAPDGVVVANTFKAFYKTPEFYQPNYDEKPDEKLIPDFRNTLVWKTNLLTDENGDAELTFFTSDIRSIFNGKVEGFGANGYIGLSKFKIRVLK